MNLVPLVKCVVSVLVLNLPVQLLVFISLPFVGNTGDDSLLNRVRKNKVD